MGNMFVGSLALPPNLFAIDGITRSGKFWLAEIIAYFDHMEPVIHEPVLDFISIQAAFGEIDQRTASELFKNIVSYKCFCSSIGRNLNQRLGDSSSIYNNPRRTVFLNRVHEIHDQAYEHLKPTNFSVAAYPVLGHDWLSVWGVQKAALPGIKVMRVERHPIDLTHAWHNTGIGRNDMAFSHRYSFEGRSLPWFASGFATEFDGMPEMDRIIHSIAWLSDAAYPVLNAAVGGGDADLLITSYERMGDDLTREVERIAAHIGLQPMPEMKGYIEQRKLKPRSDAALRDAREKKLALIRSLASDRAVTRLLELSERYEAFAARLGN
jgi:hypothetical protein